MSPLLTHNDIATMVGMTRETVSIEMGKLAQKNLVGYRGRRLVVMNRRGLVMESAIDSVP